MGDDLWISIYGTDTRQIRRILNFIQHPDYSEASMDNDIAVIRVRNRFIFYFIFLPFSLLNEPVLSVLLA